MRQIPEDIKKPGGRARREMVIPVILPVQRVRIDFVSPDIGTLPAGCGGYRSVIISQKFF